MPLLILRVCLIEARHSIDQVLGLAWRTGTCVLLWMAAGIFGRDTARVLKEPREAFYFMGVIDILGVINIPGMGARGAVAVRLDA